MEMSGDGILKRFFLSEKVPFSEKRDINWRAVKWTALAFISGFVVVVLLTPANPDPLPPDQSVSGQVAQKKDVDQQPEMLPSQREISSYYKTQSIHSGTAPSRQGSMIVSRGGLDYRTQLPPGSRIHVKLLQSAIISTESMPIVAVVVDDVAQENGTAIERGSKLFGEASFNDTGDVASVNWTSIQMADGRERQLSAIGVSLSGHVGVQGNIRSKMGRNIAGSMISRFVGAYAEGSMTRGLLGFSQGGAENGLKQAVAETAKDQADSYASDLKKEKRWIELEAGTEFLAVLKQPFSFRDPGSYGQ
jgi:hypothetical protein